MAVVSSFWVGAARVDAGHRLRLAVEELGGWGVAEGQLARVRELASAGWSERRRRLWRDAREMVTPFDVVTQCDRRYPPRLASVSDCPPALWVQGAVELLAADRMVAIVGTRNATSRALGATRLLAHRLARGGAVVVSGLARGIDRAAHEAALEAGGATIAVLGHGLAYTSPRSNRRLRQRIADNGGAVVSSWPDDLEASKATFPRRNRWIAGLAQSVCVMQAPKRSGARITARHAICLQRPVHAFLPEGEVRRGYAGCEALIEDDEAQPIRDVDATAQVLLGQRVPSTSAWLRHLFAGEPLTRVAEVWGGTPPALARELVRLELEGVVVRGGDGRYAPGKELACHVS